MGAGRTLKPLEFQRADQGGGTAQLIEREQPQGVAHQHGDAGRFDAGVQQAPVHEGECGQTEVGLRLAAAGGEEQQLDGLAIVLAPFALGLSKARQVHQHEGQLEEAPSGCSRAGHAADLIGRDPGTEG